MASDPVATVAARCLMPDGSEIQPAAAQYAVDAYTWDQGPMADQLARAWEAGFRAGTREAALRANREIRDSLKTEREGRALGVAGG